MRWLTAPIDALAAARGILFPWVPVLIGCGIGVWFALPWEPGPVHYAVLAGLLAACALARWTAPEVAHVLAIALGCVVLGALAAGARAHLVDAPILSFRYYGPVEGRIVGIDRSQSDQTRLTLDRVVLDRVPPARTPARVRVSLHGDQGGVDPMPGMTVMMTAHLSGPEGPVEPGGFDFQRMAFFDRLGAVGYTRTPALLVAPPEPRAQWVNRLRAQIKRAVMDRVPGEPGAFAAALVTGDRSGIGQATLADLRASNLAHLLAISGLHMGLLTGFVFAALRYGLALVPVLALRLPTKKIAAVIALAAAAFYLALSGGNVATQRAFVMVAVMLVAVLADRRALTLRSVAIAAVIILLAQPESLLEPGFQMSFAATTALVATFGALRGRIAPGRIPGWAMPVFTLVVSSAVAGFATAPIGAAHFNRISDYGLLANLASVPLMGTLVMPAAVVAALLAPFGLEAPALWVMEQGTRWILFVAGYVAGLDGSVTAVPAPGPAVLPVLALGALWAVLWRGRVRWLGVMPMAAALALWSSGARPDLLIAADGGLIGRMGPEGRALSAPKGRGFAARSWLENDGDLTDQETAAARPGFAGAKAERRFDFGGLAWVALSGKTGLAALDTACDSADVVILTVESPQRPGCLILDAAVLRATGPIAVDQTRTGLAVRHTHRRTRLWSGLAKGQGAEDVLAALVDLAPKRLRVATDD